MRIYSLTPLGYRVSHTTRNVDSPEWRVVHYLARVHSASNEKLESDLGVSSSVLGKLSRKNIIKDETGVSV